MATQEKKTDSARYDRQLRLWGETGQGRLEASKICLLNANATGAETLKNLVLPGIGSFTIVDNTKVSDADLGNNFFVEASSIGTPRGEVARQLLNELNGLVHSEFVEADPVQLIESKVQFFDQFNIVIASSVPEEPLLKLARYLYPKGICLFSVRSYGLVGSIRFVVGEHTIVETRGDNQMEDLRLSTPFPTLVEYAKAIDVESLNTSEHAHVPYIVLLLQNLEKWRETHDGKNPEVYSQKIEFRNIVLKGCWKAGEANYDEAYKAAMKIAPYTIPSNTKEILSDPKAVNIDANSSKFWLLAHALKEFVEKDSNGFLPLNGSLSDMTATTEGFISLQNLYLTKAAEDVAAVTARLQAALKQVGKPADYITTEEIKVFCKNSAFLKVIRYRSFDDERNAVTSRASYLGNLLQSPETEVADNNIRWYFTLRAADRFYTKNGRYPGSDDSNVESDEKQLSEILQQILTELSIQTDFESIKKYITETVRFGASELHPIASLVGGVASQEVIKAITQMYTPMSNTWIFNGINSTSLTVIV